MGMAVGMPEVKELPPAVEFAKNPLAETHEFRQACSACFVKHGEGSFDQVKSCTLHVSCGFIPGFPVLNRSSCLGLHILPIVGAQVQERHLGGPNETHNNLEAYPSPTDKKPLRRALLHLQR